MMHRFHYLKYALALVLVFVGGKIFLVNIVGKIPPAFSLSVIMALLLGGVLYSLWRTAGAAVPDERAGPDRPVPASSLTRSGSAISVRSPTAGTVGIIRTDQLRVERARAPEELPMTAATTQTATIDDAQTMTGAQVVIQALVEQGVDVIFGYPGGAVLPLYDALFQQDKIRHILVRHEQAAVHAAEGYARSTGKVGVRAGDLGPRCHQHRHRPHRRADGFGAAGLPDRPGADPHDRQRRLPGGGHGRHHPAVHQAQLPGQAARGPGPRDARGVPRRAARAGRGRSWSTCRRTSRWPRRPTSRRTRSSTAPTTRAPSPTPPGSRRRPSCWPGPSGRSSTSAAASSTPGPRPAPS